MVLSRRLALASLIALLESVNGCSKNSSPPPYSDQASTGGAVASGASNSTGGQGAGGVASSSAGGLGQSGEGTSGGSLSSGGATASGGQNPANSGGTSQGGTGSGGLGSGGLGQGGAEGCAPSIPADCTSYCTTIGTQCNQDAETCACNCARNTQPGCATELAALLTCSGSSPAVQCSPLLLVESCKSLSFALLECESEANGSLCAKDLPWCRTYCEATFGPNCPNGPESFSGCLCDCEKNLVPQCNTEFSAFGACTANAPVFGCNVDGRIVPASCTTEWTSLQACRSN